MGRNIKSTEYEKQTNPMLPLVGFVVLLILGGLSFLASPYIVQWLKTTTFSLGGFIKVLPVQFPPNWPLIVDQIAVTLVLFVLFFTIVMIALFSFMKPPGVDETSVSLDTLRREKQQKRRR